MQNKLCNLKRYIIKIKTKNFLNKNLKNFKSVEIV